jgi:hypothetical protein
MPSATEAPTMPMEPVMVSSGRAMSSEITG